MSELKHFYLKFNPRVEFPSHLVALIQYVIFIPCVLSSFCIEMCNDIENILIAKQYRTNNIQVLPKITFKFSLNTK